MHTGQLNAQAKSTRDDPISKVRMATARIRHRRETLALVHVPHLLRTRLTVEEGAKISVNLEPAIALTSCCSDSGAVELYTWALSPETLP